MEKQITDKNLQDVVNISWFLFQALSHKKNHPPGGGWLNFLKNIIT
ncbi:MAG: hypothetical protein ABJA57_02810 [Ginsengibacter sp.]